MSLDPQLAEVFSALGQLTHVDLLTPEGIARMTEVAESFHADAPSPVSVRDDILLGPHGPVPVRVYRPFGEDKVRPALIWLHGGGWVAGDLNMPEADYTSRFLSGEADIVVVSVAYRLAVDGVHFPIPNDDVIAAFEWVIAEAQTLGIDSSSLYLGGASAGGNLAAGVAMRLRDSGGAGPAGLVLVYPVLHSELPPLAPPLEDRLAELPAVLRFPPEVVTALAENFVGGPLEDASAYAFAALGQLEGFPPTLVLVSEYDDLRTSGEAFAEGLRGAGVEVDFVCEEGVPHGHLSFPRLEGTTHSLTRICSWLRSQSSKQFMTLAIDSGPDTPALPATTIGGALDHAVSAWGDRDALVSLEQGLRYTYRELATAVDALASGLAARGVSKGDRVGIWSPNCAEWVLTQYATARLGAILVTINPAYRTHELAYVLEQSGVSLLIAAPSFKTSDYVAMAAEAAPDVPAVFFETAEWQALATSTGELPAAELSPDEPINIQYTSGTTGFPKGATLSHTNILGNGFLVGEGCGYTFEDRVCVPVPFYHCFGMVMGNLGALTHGACVVIPAPAFDPAATLRAVQQERCTSLYGVPTMFIAALGLPDFDSYDVSSLRTGIMAGSPCPVEVMKQVTKFMPEVTICYGMTETSPVSTQTKADDTLEHRTATVGRVHPHVTVKVVDPESGETVQRGETGELCTGGYGVMLGYWNDPDKTAEAIDSDGFMHTGDLAVMDEDGYLSIVGRSKDRVIRGGENIYPREVEEFLYTHPDIVDAQVIGVPDAKYGEELCAWVRLRDGAPALTAEGLKEYCAGKLAHYKVPKYVRVTDEFPMTVTGKVQKFKMRETSIDELGLHDAARIITA